MAWSSWVLNYGFLKFQVAYDMANQTEEMCDMLRWPLEYFLKCWIPDEQTLYVQVRLKGKYMLSKTTEIVWPSI